MSKPTQADRTLHLIVFHARPTFSRHQFSWMFSAHLPIKKSRFPGTVTLMRCEKKMKPVLESKLETKATFAVFDAGPFGPEDRKQAQMRGKKDRCNTVVVKYCGYYL